MLHTRLLHANKSFLLHCTAIPPSEFFSSNRSFFDFRYPALFGAAQAALLRVLYARQRLYSVLAKLKSTPQHAAPCCVQCDCPLIHIHAHTREWRQPQRGRRYTADKTHSSCW